MSLVEKLLDDSRVRGPKCTVGLYRSGLTGAELTEFDEAIRAVHENRVTGAAFERWFKAKQVNISASSIRRHADGECNDS